MKYLSYLFLILIFSFSNLQAQYTDSLWQVQNQTTSIYSIPAFNNSFINAIQPYITQSSENIYTSSWPTANIMQVNYTLPSNLYTWPSLKFNTVHWDGDTTNNFVRNIKGAQVKHNIAKGYSVDMSQKFQRTVTFEIQCDESILFLGTLTDIQGKESNAVEARITVNATTGGADITNESKWQKITMTWDASIVSSGDYGSMQDGWSETWWGRKNTG